MSAGEESCDIYLQDCSYPDSKVQGANMGPTWGRQDPGGSHVGPMNIAIWVGLRPANERRHYKLTPSLIG